MNADDTGQIPTETLHAWAADDPTLPVQPYRPDDCWPVACGALAAAAALILIACGPLLDQPAAGYVARGPYHTAAAPHRQIHPDIVRAHRPPVRMGK